MNQMKLPRNDRTTMKILLVSMLLLGPVLSAQTATPINATNKYAYGANLGWIDWRGDTNNGAVIGEYVCSGYIYAANVGWIHLGGGSPANLIQYQNNASNDYGVNHDGLGNLRGYAYGANIGWINFGANGAAKVDLSSGKLSGSIYSANCGWISLTNVFAHVQTDTIQSGADGDGDGITDAWELSYTNTLTAFTALSDTDGDGVSDKNEYFADTNPTDSIDRLVITDYLTTPGGTLATLTWKSRPTRHYYLQKNHDVTTTSWLDSGLGLIVPDGVSTMRMFGDTNAPLRFYHVEAVKPLSP